MVRVAVVGAGWHGQGHINTITQIDQIELVGVCDLNENHLTKVLKKFNVPVYKNYVEMLEATKPEGVILVTPPEVRLELVREAAERGIHCFIEKPPARTLEEAQKVTEVINKTGIINSVGFMYRYSKAAEKCRELLAGRSITNVQSTMLDGIALRENWPKWFFNKGISGGPIFDQTIHIFDLSRYLLGEVEMVCGFQGNKHIQKSHDFTIEDSFSLALNYKNGPLQTHTHSWVYSGFVCQFTFVSSDMHLTLDLAEGSVRGHIDGDSISYVEEDELYKQELEAFSKAIQEKSQEPIRSSYQDSVESLSISLAMLEALETNKIVNVGDNKEQVIHIP
ncbi:Gfo/Idh/MocA family protein [Thalassobacillus pellis]|uniref:Gfo/Idh/MocA family protein n=1 Tax=Thalassobacillus pellis TaxID=748008 RepID=UPI001961EB25|nr:Gfo/Idh/MocA family oxidoreductase [Thalassobacillus pellis]MBM7554149.1 putative dehydrogenase [Thalassobacillus pellis]